MPIPSAITLVVARFEDLLARGLHAVIDDDVNLEILAKDIAHDRIDVVLDAHHPQVAILDADALENLGDVRGLGRRHPGTRLVLLTGRPARAESLQALAFGASACLGRDTQARDVLSAIHLAARGLQLIPRPSVAPQAAAPPGSHLLTPREAELVPMIQRGSSNAEIAEILQIGVETVRTHARNIYRKLGVTSRLELGEAPLRRPGPTDSPSPEPPQRQWFERTRDGERRRRAASR